MINTGCKKNNKNGSSVIIWHNTIHVCYLEIEYFLVYDLKNLKKFFVNKFISHVLP